MNNYNWAAVATRRRIWQPNNPAPMSEMAIAPMTISRCLSLTSLEPMVASFITDGLDRFDSTKLGELAISTLLDNIQDEARHELALDRARLATINYTSQFEMEGLQIAKAWEELPDHPILKTACLECGVFFVVLPLYSQFGGNSLRITAGSISGDERLHVETHRTAARLIGTRPSLALNKLRLETIYWAGQNIDELGDPRWTVDRLIKNSNSLMSRGVSDLIETRVCNVNAPFELNNRSLENYN